MLQLATEHRPEMQQKLRDVELVEEIDAMYCVCPGSTLNYF